ncbi:MAG: MFS transporter [Chloroflexi bacterium]|nr:MAG: MFS transporter [Chloroflexota bacterium]
MFQTERQGLGKGSAVAAVIAGNLLFGTGLIFHAFLYNFYLEGLHLPTEVMGHAAAALTAGGLVMLLPAGVLTDRTGPRTAVTIAAAVLAVGLALGAVATTPLAVYAAAAIAGAGSGIWRVATPPILMGLTEPSTRARAFAWNVGLLVGWGGLGTAIAGLTPGWLEHRWGLTHLLAMRGALILGTVGSAASLVLFRGGALRGPLERTAVASAPATPHAPALANGASPEAMRRILLLVSLVAVWMLGPALAAPFFNIFFSHEQGLPIARIGVVFAAVNGAWALAVLASGEAARRLGVSRVLNAALLLFAPAMLGLSVAGGVQLAVTLYFSQGLIAPVTNPLIDQWLLGQTSRERQGLVSSWRQVAADLSGMIGASFGGYLLASGGFDSLFRVAAAIGLVGGLGLIGGARLGRRR